MSEQKQWHFQAWSDHIEVEEIVSDEERLNILNAMVRWAHVRHVNLKSLRAKDRLTIEQTYHDPKEKNKMIRVKNALLNVRIEPIRPRK